MVQNNALKMKSNWRFLELSNEQGREEYGSEYFGQIVLYSINISKTLLLCGECEQMPLFLFQKLNSEFGNFTWNHLEPS